MSETRQKHTPERTCVACRKKRPQQECLRFTRTVHGWEMQTGRKRSGRGVYLCADSLECWQERRLRRSFRQDAPDIAARLQNRSLATVTPPSTD